MGPTHDPGASPTGADRRRHPRRGATGRVVLHPLSDPLLAQADNISEGGLLVYAQGELRVEVEVEIDGRRERRRGRICRLQRMLDERLGLAIEFDD